MTGRTYPVHRAWRIIYGALIATGCAHGDPFVPGDNGTDAPLDPARPTRLTYNIGIDRAPVWTPDGAAIVYSLTRADRAERDRCLGTLPATGGRVLRMRCERPLFNERTTDVLDEPAPAADGRIAYVRSSGTAGLPFPAAAELMLAGDTGEAGRPLHSLIQRRPDGRVRQTATHIRWLADDALVYVAAMFYVRTGGQRDTAVSGIDIAHVVLAEGASVVSPVPGTENASSVAAGEEPDLIYYTIGGDSRVYRRRLDGSAPSVVHDFGTGRIARDVQIAGDRLIAVVDGQVTFDFDEQVGFLQRDEGGDIHVVNLATGADTKLAAGDLLFRRPQLAPSGRAVIAEGRVAGGSPDIWLLEAP